MFLGADTDEMRAVAKALDDAATALGQLADGIVTSGEQLVWEGDDAVRFRAMLAQLQTLAKNQPVAALVQGAVVLRQNAAAQDATSATLDGGGGAGTATGLNRLLGTDGGAAGVGGGVAGSAGGFATGAAGAVGGGVAGVGGVMSGVARTGEDDRPWWLPEEATAGHEDWGTSGGQQKWLDDTIKDPLHPDAKDPYEAHVSVVDGETDAAWWRKETGDHSTNLGPVVASGSASVALLSAQASGSAGLYGGSDGNVGVYAKGEAGAYLAEASAAGALTYGVASASGTAHAGIGAEGSAEGRLTVGKDGLVAKAGGEAFAGARATAEGSVDVGGVGVGVGGQAWAGVGAKFEASAEFSAKEVSVGVDMGAALGIGGSLEFEVKVEPQKIWETVGSWGIF